MAGTALTGLLSLTSLLAVVSLRSLEVNVVYPESSIGLSSMFLRGSSCGLNWSNGVKMHKTRQDTWTASVECEKDSVVELKALINDRTWMIGANHHVNFESDGASTTIYPWFSTYQGNTQVFPNVYSPELENYRDVIVYFPPSYFENPLKLHKNVLIMHDGQNLFNPRTAFMGNAWMIQDSLNPMIVNGDMDEVLVVGVYNTANRTYEYTYSYDPSEGFGGDGDKYLDFLESTIIPMIKSKFRVDIQREYLGILGSSLGGLISCYAGWTRSEVYGKIGCMSSSFWWNDQDFQREVLPNHLPPTKPVFYLDSGTSGGEASCAVYSAQIKDYMVSKDYKEDIDVFYYVDKGASHSESYWGKRFYLPMLALYPSITV